MCIRDSGKEVARLVQLTEEIDAWLEVVELTAALQRSHADAGKRGTRLRRVTVCLLYTSRCV